MARELFTLNPALDRAALAAAFARDGRVQLRDFLTAGAAREVHRLLGQHTAWGLAWQAGADGPHSVDAAALRKDPVGTQQRIAGSTAAAAAKGDYAVQFARYPMVDAYLGKWAPDGPHDLLLEHINAAPMIELVRDVTGLAAIVKGDAQATLFAPGHFLGLHNDTHVADGWLVAYVMSFCVDWKPDWGGYLAFYDDDGDIVAGLKPRFNSLNLFRVPQAHAVTYVPPFAPIGRLSITGWFRDR